MTVNPMNSELKACPFCGSQPYFRHAENGLWQTGCGNLDDCLAGVTWGHFATRAEAITAWNTRKSEALADEAVERAAELRDVVMPVIGACLLMRSDDPKLAHPRLGVAAEVANAVTKHLSALRSTPPEVDLRAVDLLREARCPLCQTAAPEAFVSQCNRPECPYRSNTK